jgi:rhamnosyltransferase
MAIAWIAIAICAHQEVNEVFLVEYLPRVTVLVAAFNGMEWINQQLDSILAQRGVEVSLLISVDPCTDGTLQYCLDYAARHERIVVLPLAGPFGCAARNFFHLLKQVDLHSANFVALADQDDLWHTDKLLRAVNHLQASGDGGYSSNVTAFWPDGRRQLLEKAQPQVGYDHLFEAGGPGCTYVLPASVAKSLQHHLHSVGDDLWAVNFHDWYIYAWVRSRRLRWYIDPLPSMDYRQHPSNQLGANTSVKSFMNRWASVGSGGWFEQVRLIARLTRTGPKNGLYNYLSFDRIHLLGLAFRAGQCRRRRRDQVFFALVCLRSAIALNRSLLSEAHARQGS